MRTRRIVVTLVAIAGVTASASTAVAAPVSTKAPSITGQARFASVVGCDKGTWTGDPVSFSYVWLVGGSGRGTGPRFAIDDTFYMGGFNITCQVTATDAGGATATAVSAAQRPATGATTMRGISITRRTKGRFTIKGQIGPALLNKSFGGGNQVVLYRKVGKKAVTQLGTPANVNRLGRFTANGTDAAGRRTIIISFVPGRGSFGIWSPLEVRRTIQVSPGGQGFGGGGTVGIG